MSYSRITRIPLYDPHLAIQGFLRSEAANVSGEAAVVMKGKRTLHHYLDRGFTAHNRNYTTKQTSGTQGKPMLLAL